MGEGAGTLKLVAYRAGHLGCGSGRLISYSWVWWSCGRAGKGSHLDLVSTRALMQSLMLRLSSSPDGYGRAQCVWLSLFLLPRNGRAATSQYLSQMSKVHLPEDISLCFLSRTQRHSASCLHDPCGFVQHGTHALRGGGTDYFMLLLAGHFTRTDTIGLFPQAFFPGDCWACQEQSGTSISAMESHG